jgi:pimeloyl-ACP methyl ester carboxylesterase
MDAYSNGELTVVALRFSDVVVLLPGLIDSVLSKDGKPLWGTSPGALWGIVAGENPAKLRLTAADDGQEDLGDGIVPTALVPNPELVPGLWKQGGYSILSQALVDRLGLDPGENYFEFPYDWRRDNRVAAMRLAKDASAWLSTWRSRSGNADAKLVLIAHSMGGLVGRYFVECLEGWRSVRTLVSFGTPYRGSGNALDFLCNGFKWKVGPLSLFEGTAALRSFDSVYQLLPAYRFVGDGAAPLVRVSDLSLPNLDPDRAAKAMDFHDAMTRARVNHMDDEGYAATGTRVRPVVGISQPTWQSAVLAEGKLTLSRSRDGAELGGDGTVSRVAAIPFDDDGGTATYVATTHSALQSVAAALDQVQGIATGAEIDLAKFRTDVPGLGHISLVIEDAYVAEEPVRVAAIASEYAQALSATIERLDAPDCPRKLTLFPKDGIHRYEAMLPSGLYRVSVQGKSFRTVEDVFLVLDAGLSA